MWKERQAVLYSRLKGVYVGQSSTIVLHIYVRDDQGRGHVKPAEEIRAESKYKHKRYFECGLQNGQAYRITPEGTNYRDSHP